MSSVVRPALYLPIEVKTRELKAKLLIALFAVARGFEVCVGQKEALGLFLGKLQRGTVFGKSLSDIDASLFTGFRQLGHDVVAMDEELLVYINRQIIAGYLAPQAVEACSMLFVPGQDGAEVIRARVPAAADRVRIVGMPRMDLLRPNLMRRQAAARAEEIRRQHGDFFLVSGTYVLANCVMPAEAYLGVMQQCGYIRNAEDRRFFEEFFAHDVRRLQAMLGAVRHVAARLPHVNLVVRPHPQEQPEPYFEALAGLPNVTISLPKEPVDAWLLAARGLIQHSCTTAIEANALGVPVLAYTEVDSPRFDPALPNTVAHHGRTPDEATAWVADVLAGRRGAAARTVSHDGKDFGFYLDDTDERLSAARIVDGLEELERARTLPADGRGAPSRFAGIPYVAEPFPKPVLTAAKFPDTPLAEIERMVEDFTASLPELARVRIANPVRDVFVLLPA